MKDFTSHIEVGDSLVVCTGLVKIYKVADLEVVALQGLDLSIGRGELMAIIGNSGSGKSTLLNILGGLDRPSAGSCRMGDLDLVNCSESDLVYYKRHIAGFVWQQSSRNLIPYLSALENVETPMIFSGLSGRVRRDRARELLETVGLGDRMGHSPGELSGGQQQRVAIAVSLANDPDILLADEPTGEVDTETAHLIYDLFHDLNRERGLTVVVVSHDRGIANQVDRVVAIRDGRTSTETVRRIGGEHTDEVSHEEYVIVDDVGRLQIPHEHLEQAGIAGRAVVEYDEGRVIIKSAANGDEEQPRNAPRRAGLFGRDR